MVLNQRSHAESSVHLAWGSLLRSDVSLKSKETRSADHNNNNRVIRGSFYAEHWHRLSIQSTAVIVNNNVYQPQMDNPPDPTEQGTRSVLP